MAQLEAVRGDRYPPQRQARLLDRLRADRFVDIQGLREELGVSIATIRRDLTELEARGLLRRTHGGAIALNQVTNDWANDAREVTNAEEKQRIGAVAADMVVEGDAVIVDAGTTSLQVARHLAHRESLTFITNGLDICSALAGSGRNTLFVAGGQYIDVNHSFAGPLAAEAVRRYSVDRAFLSVSSVDLARGVISTSSPTFACVQQAMIEVAQTVIVVADHSKFSRAAALSVICPLTEVDYIVTGEETRAGNAAAIERYKRKFIFA